MNTKSHVMSQSDGVGVQDVLSLLKPQCLLVLERLCLWASGGEELCVWNRDFQLQCDARNHSDSGKKSKNNR